MSRLHIFARLVFAYVSEPTISSVSRAISSGGIADGRSVEPAAAGFACGLGKSLRMISLVRNGGHRAIWPVGNAQTFFFGPSPPISKGNRLAQPFFTITSVRSFISSQPVGAANELIRSIAYKWTINIDRKVWFVETVHKCSKLLSQALKGGLNAPAAVFIYASPSCFA